MQVHFRADHQAQASGVQVRQMSVDQSKEAKLFKILSDGLYRDKKSSVIREVCSNAFDAHVMAGKRDVPFQMHVPTWEERWFEVKDFGVGLTEEEAFLTIFSYLGSYKDTSNEFIGGWGLGSKSPYAYTNTFEVVTVKGGHRWEFNCWMSEDGLPQAALFKDRATDEPNGVEYRVPVRPEDVVSFRDACLKYLARTNFPIEVSNAADLEGHLNEQSWAMAEFEADGYKFYISRHDHGEYNVLYGGVTYPTSEIARLQDKLAPVVSMMKSGKFSLLIEAKIGDCDFSVSRESMSDTDRTVDWIEGSVTALAEALAKASVEHFEERLLPAAEYFKSQVGNNTIDLAILDSIIKEQQDSDPGKERNPVFEYVSFSSYIQVMQPATVKKLVKEKLGVDGVEWGHDLFHFNVPLRHPESFKTAIRRYSRANLKQVKHLSAGYVGGKYKTNRGSKFESAFERPLRFSLTDPATSQILVLWHPRPVKASKLHSNNHEDKLQTYLMVAESQEIAVRLMEACGVKSAPVEALKGHVGYEYEEVVRKGSNGSSSTELPVKIWCDSAEAIVGEYDPAESYVYDVGSDSEPMPLSVRALFNALGHLPFTASKTFMKRHGGLDNIFHWTTAMEDLALEWEPVYKSSVALKAWKEVTLPLSDCENQIGSLVWRFITSEEASLERLQRELGPYGVGSRMAVVLRDIYRGFITPLKATFRNAMSKVDPEAFDLLGVGDEARRVEAAALRPFRKELLLAATEYASLQETAAYKAIRWESSGIKQLPPEKRFALMQFLKQLGI
jgi:hypothetical protein